MISKEISGLPAGLKGIRSGLLGVVLFGLTVVNCHQRSTLTILGEDSSNLRAMESLKAEYERQAGITIDFKKDEFEVAYEKANQDFANQTGLYDIVLQYNFSLSSFVRNDYVYKIGDLQNFTSLESLASAQADLFDNAWKEVGFYYVDPLDPEKGETAIGYPFAANTMMLVYNRELFQSPTHQEAYKRRNNEDLTTPTTWAQFKRIADYFTARDKSTYGVCLQGGAGGWLYYEYCNFLYGMNGAVMTKDRGWKGDESTPILLDSPQAIEATNFYLSLKPDNAGDFFQTGAVEQRERMKGGKIAMAIMWSDYVYGLVYEGNKRDDRFGFAPIPGDRSMLAGGIYYINKRSNHAKEAMQYVMHTLQKETQVELMKQGLCSPVRTAYDDPQLQQHIPYANALRQSLERGVYMVEAGPDANTISETITEYLQKMWNGSMKVQEGLSLAKREVESKRKDIFTALRKEKAENH